MTRLTRFEKKILGSILIVALVPMLVTFFLGRDAIGDAYRIGVNAQVRDQLEGGLEARRAYLMQLRGGADHIADAMANNWALQRMVTEGDVAGLRAFTAAVAEGFPAVAAVKIFVEDEAVYDLRLSERLDLDVARPLQVDRELPAVRGGRLELTIVAPIQVFDDFQDAGEYLDFYSRLEDQTAYVSKVYVLVYGALLGVIVALTLALSLVLSRRVTKRVAALAVATEKVGAGDLSVSVPTDAQDEIGELSRAFNEMVSDLRDSRQRIEYLQRIGAWQDFARRLAHEIKNPLTPIQLAAQELEGSYAGDDPAYGAKLAEATSIIEEEVATLRALVGEFSSFAKLPRARLAPADFGDFLHDVERAVPGILSDTRLTADAPEVRVRFEVPTDSMPVRIDAMMLKRCVDNLVRNAVESLVISPPKGGGRVVIRASRSGAGVRVDVRDNGSGVRESDRERVFDPYFTTKREGTGLGLAIVKKVVLEHGGTIECRAAADGGARFTIRLPNGMSDDATG